jgi:hypothetical protein
MSSYPVGRRPRYADPHSDLRLAAISAVVVGVVLLAAAAFVFSYAGIHHIALQAGVSPRLARLYPVMFDAMLVIAGAAAMALRGAGWWPRFYAWATLIVLLAALATADAVHATNTALPEPASRAAVAVTPWVLLLLAFGLLLEMLRHFRSARAAVAARQAALAYPGAADAGAPAGADDAAASLPPAAVALPPGAGPTALPAGTGTTARPADAGGGAAAPASVTWAGAGGQSASESHASLVDMLLGPRPGEPPAVEVPYGITPPDPVSYGEETGYVHPDSYRDEGEYAPHGDSGGPVVTRAGGAGNGEVPAATLAGTAGTAQHPGPPIEHGPAGEPPGAAGEHGPAAERGPAGESGPTVDSGPAGEPGPAGQHAPAAEAESTGEPGAVGEHAPAATRGSAAAHAPGGESGPAAAPGSAGESGPAEDTGPAAEHGPAGESAPAGESGPAEDTGPAAEHGPAGESAPAGESERTGESKLGGEIESPGDGAADEHGGDAATGDATGTEDVGLERMHSSPTRPEE